MSSTFRQRKKIKENKKSKKKKKKNLIGSALYHKTASYVFEPHLYLKFVQVTAE